MKYTFLKDSKRTIHPEQGLELKIILNATKICVYD